MCKINLKIFVLAVLLFVCSVFSGCSLFGSEELFQRQSYAMGASAVMSAYGSDADAVLKLCEDELKRLDKLFSLSDPDSDIYKINSASGGAVTVSGEVSSLIKRSIDISERTLGAFDITIAPIVKLWGFYDGLPKIPTTDDLYSIFFNIGYENITLDQNSVALKPEMMIDISGMTKGYALDRMKSVLSSYDVKNAKISFGDTTLLMGSTPDGKGWSLPIPDPLEPLDSTMCVLKASNVCVATSHIYQNYFKRGDTVYHNIIDPADFFPADNGIISVTVIASNGAEAQALSSALLILGTTSASDFWRNHQGFEAIIVCDDMQVLITPGLSEKLFLESENSPYSFSLLS